MNTTDPTNIPYKLLGNMEQSAPLQGLPPHDNTDDLRLGIQELTALYVTTMYYSALANLYLQSILPDNIEEVKAQMPRVQIAVERSYADFTAASDWISKYGKELIQSSPAQGYYNEVAGLEKGTVKNMVAIYS